MHCPAVPLRHLSALILAAFSALPLLTACGGGSGPSPNPNATTVVTPPSTTGSSSIGMDISSTTVTINQPATVTATLLDAQGNPLANRVLKFAVDASLATLTPSSGTVLTDSKGMARVQLNARPVERASNRGQITLMLCQSFAGGQKCRLQGRGSTQKQVIERLGQHDRSRYRQRKTRRDHRRKAAAMQRLRDGAELIAQRADVAGIAGRQHDQSHLFCEGRESLAKLRRIDHGWPVFTV